MATDWSKLKVTDLKAELKRRDLSTAGLKQDLVNRLVEADEAQAEDEPTIDADEDNATESNHEEAAKSPQPEADSETTADIIVDSAPPTATETLPTPETAEVVSTDPAPAELSQTLSTNDNAPQTHQTQSTEPSTGSIDNDLQKRKRRSVTPPPSIKRVRQEEDQEDAVDYGAGEIEAKQDQAAANTEAKDSGEATETTQVEGDAAMSGTDQTQDAQPANGHAPRSATPVHQASENDVQMRDTHQDESEEALNHKSSEVVEDDRMITPAIHPATSALYIRDFMRPLRGSHVEEYLVDLAAPTGAQPDPNVVLAFHLDQIRTHAFVVFKNAAAAIRVRSSLHDRVWPDEKNRKPLWVDFVPPAKVQGWIDQELAAGRGRQSRWEIIYDQDSTGVTTTFVEVDADNRPPPRQPPTGPAVHAAPADGPAPTYPGIDAAPRGPRGAAPQMNQGHFGERTQAQPSISYQPVDAELAQKRIDNIRGYVSQEENRNLGREINRYTFEERDTFVDRGKEVFIGIRPPAREKAHQEMLRQQAMGGGSGGGGGGSGAAALNDSGRNGYGTRYDDSRGPPTRYNDRYGDRDRRRDGGDRRGGGGGGYGGSRDDRSYRQPDRNRGRYRDDPYRYRP